MYLKKTACVFMLAAWSAPAQLQATFTDAVLSQSSDLTGCTAQPSPAPHTTPGGIRSPANTQNGDVDPCSDLGSTYQIVSAGHLYGLKRTSADVQHDAALQALGNSTAPGVLAFQPTGLHVVVSRNGELMRVKLKNRQSVYTILYTR